VKLEIAPDALAGATAFAARVIGLRPATPVYGAMRLAAGEDGTLTITATDGEAWNTATAQGVPGEPGIAVVSGRMFADMVGTLPGRAVAELTVAGEVLRLECGSARFTLPLMPADTYPAVPATPVAAGTAGAVFFADAVASVLPAIDSDAHGNPALLGVQISSAGDRLTFAGTNKYRVAANEIPWTPQDGQPDFKVLVPAQAMHALVRVAGQAREMGLAFSLDGGMVGVTAGEHTMVARSIPEGGMSEFPPWRRFIPSDFAAVAIINTSDMAAAVKRAALALQAQDDLMFDFAAGHVRLSGGADGITGEDAIAIEWDGEPLDLTMAFCAQYFLDAITAAGSTKVRLGINAPLKPVLVTPDGDRDDDYRHLVMPRKPKPAGQ
jgi:DNA polymerase III subunit beta